METSAIEHAGEQAWVPPVPEAQILIAGGGPVGLVAALLLGGVLHA